MEYLFRHYLRWYSSQIAILLMFFALDANSFVVSTLKT